MHYEVAPVTVQTTAEVDILQAHTSIHQLIESVDRDGCISVNRRIAEIVLVVALGHRERRVDDESRCTMVHSP